jgi:hypothetical protein
MLTADEEQSGEEHELWHRFFIREQNSIGEQCFHMKLLWSAFQYFMIRDGSEYKSKFLLFLLAYALYAYGIA